MKPITDEQLACLKTYANAEGRTWKSKLLDDWMKASAVPQLQWLRNSHGPSWLKAFRLPKD